MNSKCCNVSISLGMDNMSFFCKMFEFGFGSDVWFWEGLVVLVGTKGSWCIRCFVLLFA